MPLIYRKSLKQTARNLRRRMSDAEIRLWSRIRLRQLDDCQFYRQRVIGNYIVDFYCPTARLVIEVDGGQHYHGKALQNDDIRDKYMLSNGLTVLRFADNEVLKNIDGVLESIYKHLTAVERKSPLIPLSPKGDT